MMMAMQQQQRQTQQEWERPKTFVEGDFQPNVWNGSSTQQQAQQNPYAEEWPQQERHQIEQNNLGEKEMQQVEKGNKREG